MTGAIQTRVNNESKGIKVKRIVIKKDRVNVGLLKQLEAAGIAFVLVFSGAATALESTVDRQVAQCERLSDSDLKAALNQSEQDQQAALDKISESIGAYEITVDELKEL